MLFIFKETLEHMPLKSLSHFVAPELFIVWSTLYIVKIHVVLYKFYTVTLFMTCAAEERSHMKKISRGFTWLIKVTKCVKKDF